MEYLFGGFLGYVWIAVGLMSGLLSIYREWFTIQHPDKVLPKHLFWSSVRIAFIVSAALAWFGQYHKVQQLEEQVGEKQTQIDNLTKPKLVFRLGQSASNYQSDLGMTAFLVEGTIINQGADSAVVDWKSHYKSSTLDKDVNLGVPLREPVLFGTSKSNAVIAYYGSQSIMNKASHPIPRGGYITGRVLLAIPGNHVSEISNGIGLVTITIKDYLEQPYTAFYRGGGGNEEPSFLPGELPAIKPKGK
jgi:hypothetical protein